MKMNNENIINCPECGAALDIDNVLFHQLEEKAKKSMQDEYNAKIKDLKNSLEEKFDQKEEKLKVREKDFLLKNLNTRWLISATDTFADFSDDDAIKSLSVACSCLLNTVKIQESERFITNAKSCIDDKEKIARLDNEERFPLFDGISVFKVGTDDTLRNMRWKIDKVAKINIAGEILLEIFLRLQEHDTVFKRLRDRHTRSKTGWW